MQLPYRLEKLKALNLGKTQLLRHIRARRKAIRWHRDQKLDDRCHFDDYQVWKFVLDAPVMPTRITSPEMMMQQCIDFYQFRRANKPDPIPEYAIIDPRKWDIDLKSMDAHQLLQELARLQKTIEDHVCATRPITITYDRWLYQVLPEKIPADFRLPARKDFLGERRAPQAGCPSFIRSHQNCRGKCNLSKWGPCTYTRVKVEKK
jgi:hypothetical protein